MEYSGYGASSGRFGKRAVPARYRVFPGFRVRPSSGNTYADVEAAYDYLVTTKGLSPKRTAKSQPRDLPAQLKPLRLFSRIVAYGQSVGRHGKHLSMPGNLVHDVRYGASMHTKISRILVHELMSAQELSAVPRWSVILHYVIYVL